MKSVDYESIWNDVWGDMQRYGPVHRHHRRIFDSLIELIPRNDVSTVADIGCGEGSNLLYLQSKFPNAKLFGFDISHTAMEKAKSRVNSSFAVLDIRRGCMSRQFDFVMCSDVLEHIDDDVSAINNIHSITNQYALITSVQGRMREFENSIGHVRNYAYGELQGKLESAGFKTVSVVQWGFPSYSPLYRDLLDIWAVENVTHGRYGFVKKALCNVLYVAFLLNRHDRGDIIFVLVRK